MSSLHRLSAPHFQKRLTRVCLHGLVGRNQAVTELVEFVTTQCSGSWAPLLAADLVSCTAACPLRDAEPHADMRLVSSPPPPSTPATLKSAQFAGLSQRRAGFSRRLNFVRTMTVMSIEAAGHKSLQLDMPPALPLNR